MDATLALQSSQTETHYGPMRCFNKLHGCTDYITGQWELLTVPELVLLPYVLRHMICNFFHDLQKLLSCLLQPNFELVHMCLQQRRSRVDPLQREVDPPSIVEVTP